MTKNFGDYLIRLVSVMGGIGIMNAVRAAFETIFNTDLLQIRWGIWTCAIIAVAWFVWRGIDGFYRRMDFWVDENDHRW